ncbi:4-alpha-N-acetylgalactosaminyltransferase [compost metagenome]
MKKIAIILPSLRNVGPNKVALTIVKENLCSSELSFKVFYIKEQIELDFPCEAEKLSLSTFRQLYEFDVIHSHMLRPDIINAILPFYKGKKISTIHNIVTDDLYYSHGHFISKLVSRFWFKIWSLLDNVIVLSMFAKNFYVKNGLSEEQVLVIYNGIEKDNSLESIDKSDKELILNFKANKKLIAALCLANARKGLEQVIEALVNLPEYKFILIGDGPIVTDLRTLALERKVSERFLVLGYRKNARKFLQYVDYFIMPSRSEGFPLALIEAVEAKKKVVCSSLPLFKEIYDKNEVSFFELDNIATLEEAIRNADENDTESAYSKTKQNYSGEAMGKNYRKCYLSDKESK